MTPVIQQISHYQDLYALFTGVKERWKQRGWVNRVMYPLDGTIHVASNVLADGAVKVISCSSSLLFLPAKWGRAAIGWPISRVAGLFSSSARVWVEKTWNTPITINLLLAAGRCIESWTKGTATATPTRWPLLSILDKCRIAFCRHIYVVFRDLNSLLRLPDTLRGYVDWKTIDVEPQRSSDAPSLSERAWAFVKTGCRYLANALLALIARIVKVVAPPLKKNPYTREFIEWAGERIDQMRNQIHESLIRKAHEVIDDKEAQIQQLVIEKVMKVGARTFLKKILHISIKGTMTAWFYGAIRDQVLQVIDYKDVPKFLIDYGPLGLKMVGVGLFLYTILPAIEQLHKDYKEEFDADTSTLWELSKLANRQNLPVLVQFIRDKYKQ